MPGREAKYCEHAEMLFSSLIFGELGEEEQKELLDHVAGCASCSARQAALSETARLLKEGMAKEPALRLPEERRKELVTVLGAILAGAKKEKKKRRFPVYKVAGWAAAALLMLVVGAGMLMPVLGRARMAANRGMMAYQDMEGGPSSVMGGSEDERRNEQQAQSVIKEESKKAKRERSDSDDLAQVEQDDTIESASVYGGMAKLNQLEPAQEETKISSRSYGGMAKLVQQEPAQYERKISDRGKTISRGKLAALSRPGGGIAGEKKEEEKKLANAPAKATTPQRISKAGQTAIHSEQLDEPPTTSIRVLKAGKARIINGGSPADKLKEVSSLASVGDFPHPNPSSPKEREALKNPLLSSEENGRGPTFTLGVGRSERRSSALAREVAGASLPSGRTAAAKDQMGAKDGESTENPAWTEKSLDTSLSVSKKDTISDNLAPIAAPVITPTLPEPQAQPVEPAPHNPFVMTSDDQLSTFGLDTDTASYFLTSRYVKDGYLPPPALVRTEEFVNAFDYQYPVQGKSLFSINLDGAPSPFGRGLVLLRVGIVAREAENNRPRHLVAVVDTSSSMNRPDRLPLVKIALKALISKFGPEDRISLISTREKAFILLECAEAKDPATIETIEQLQADGATNLEIGLLTGFEVAQRGFMSGGENRVLLLSDGVANVGQTSSVQLLEKLAIFRKQGLGLSTAGFGRGSYNDEAMERLANRCDGMYFYVESEDDAKSKFPEAFRSSMNLAAKDARVQVEFDPTRVRRYRLLGYENRDIADSEFRNDGVVDGGEVAAGKGATALYELELLADAASGEGVASGKAALGQVFVRWQHADSGKFEEISCRILPLHAQACRAVDNPRLFLAAAVAEYAEILRMSPYAKDGSLDEVILVARHVASALPFDAEVQSFLDLVEESKGLPRAAK